MRLSRLTEHVAPATTQWLIVINMNTKGYYTYKVPINWVPKNPSELRGLTPEFTAPDLTKAINFTTDMPRVIVAISNDKVYPVGAKQ